MYRRIRYAVPFAPAHRYSLFAGSDKSPCFGHLSYRSAPHTTSFSSPCLLVHFVGSSPAPLAVLAPCAPLALFAMLGRSAPSQFGLAFSYNTEAMTGSTKDPPNPSAVAKVCYISAVVYMAFVVFCGCQVSLSLDLRFEGLGRLRWENRDRRCVRWMVDAPMMRGLTIKVIPPFIDNPFIHPFQSPIPHSAIETIPQASANTHSSFQLMTHKRYPRGVQL